MKEFSKDEIKKFYKARVAKVVNYLNENKISLAVFIDNEEHRDPAIPYFTGHPSDAILIITSDGSSVLIPWDEILAKKVAVRKSGISSARVGRLIVPIKTISFTVSSFSFTILCSL